MAKRDFFVELPQIIAANMGQTTISRTDLKAYCEKNNVSIPALIKQHRAGRGMFNLQPLLDAGKQLYNVAEEEPEPIIELTDEELLDNINSRFASLDLMTYGVVNGDFRSMIVSGNPGIGKTYTLEYILESAQDNGKITFTSVRGFVRATGLFRLLYEHKEKGQVIMFDDADSVFADENGLNLLKAALDTTKKRTISWRTEKFFNSDEDGEAIPKYFDFNGSVIFVSNLDFERNVKANNRLAPHMEALMSRSYYLNLNLTGTRELLLRIQSVVDNSDILSSMDLSKKQQKEITTYISTNVSKLRELSLRTIIKLGTIMKASAGDAVNFKRMADATSLKRSA
jgi:hypothetical protein